MCTNRLSTTGRFKKGVAFVHRTLTFLAAIEDLRGKPWGAYVGTVATMHKNGWNPTKLFDGGL